MNIEFVSYTGSFPNLCSGVLTLKIDDRIVKFGHESGSYNWRERRYRDDNYDEFWTSGGCTGFDDNGDCQIETADWEFRYNADEVLPEYLRPYKDELLRVFNKNVPAGCCGGCI